MRGGKQGGAGLLNTLRLAPPKGDGCLLREAQPHCDFEMESWEGAWPGAGASVGARAVGSSLASGKGRVFSLAHPPGSPRTFSCLHPQAGPLKSPP